MNIQSPSPRPQGPSPAPDAATNLPAADRVTEKLDGRAAQPALQSDTPRVPTVPDVPQGAAAALAALPVLNDVPVQTPGAAAPTAGPSALQPPGMASGGPGHAVPSDDPAAPGLRIDAQISERMLTLTELVQTVKKAMSDMRELMAEGAVEAAQAQKKLIEAQARILRFVNNPPTPAERAMLQFAQARLQRDLAQLETRAAWMAASNSGQPLTESQKAILDEALLRIADDLVKIADLTQGSVNINKWRDLHRPTDSVRGASQAKATQERLGSAEYQADLSKWVAGETGAARHDANERALALRRESDVGLNSAALARSTLASGAEIQALVATLMDDILPGDVLEEVRQGLAMLQAFSAADLAVFEALKADRFGPGARRAVSSWDVSHFEREVSEAMRRGDSLSRFSRSMEGRSPSSRDVKFDTNALRTSVLMGDLQQAREALKAELKELAALQESLAAMEQQLGELVRMISQESLLMTSQWDTQQLGDLTRDLVQHSA